MFLINVLVFVGMFIALASIVAGQVCVLKEFVRLAPWVFSLGALLGIAIMLLAGSLRG